VLCLDVDPAKIKILEDGEPFGRPRVPFINSGFVDRPLKPYCPPMKKSSGFTLIEAVVVVAIIAILTALAAPSFKSLIQSNAMSSNVNSFLSDMRFARSEAVRRGGSVVMCGSKLPESTQSCNASSATNGWVTGWIVFDDLDKDGAHDANEPVLRVQGPIKNLDSIIEPNSPSYKFKFNATGRLPGNMTEIDFGSDYLPDTVQRVVCVSVGGRARIKGDGSTSCS
jgi:type IV fimbrial biogenesis protein FimT